MNATAGTAFASATTGNLPGLNVTVNNGLVVTVAIPKDNTSVLSITDTVGSTYTLKKSQVLAATSHIEIWTATVAATNASNVITINLVASSKFEAQAVQYSFPGAPGFGTTNGNTGTSTSATVTGTTLNSGDWIVGGVCANGTGTLSAGASTNQRATAVTSGGGGASNAAGNECDSGAEATAGTFTLTTTISASEGWAAASLILSNVTSGSTTGAIREAIRASVIASSKISGGLTEKFSAVPTASSKQSAGATLKFSATATVGGGPVLASGGFTEKLSAVPTASSQRPAGLGIRFSATVTAPGAQPVAVSVGGLPSQLAQALEYELARPRVEPERIEQALNYSLSWIMTATYSASYHVRLSARAYDIQSLQPRLQVAPVPDNSWQQRVYSRASREHDLKVPPVTAKATARKHYKQGIQARGVQDLDWN